MPGDTDSRKRPPALQIVLMLLAVGLVVLGIATAPSLLWGQVRDFVRSHFAAVRRDPATHAASARDAEMRDAYAVVAASRRESVSFFTDSGSLGSPLAPVAATWCVKADVSGPAGTRTIGVVVTERRGARGAELAVQALSARRTCVCRKRMPCRLE